jgi:PAS domain-containing protein
VGRAFDSTIVRVPLEALPLAAAVLDPGWVIRGANQQFRRLSGQDWSRVDALRLPDIVAEPDRPGLQEALDELVIISHRVPHVRCRVEVCRVTPPPLLMSIDISRLGPKSSKRYLACLSPVPRRRGLDVAPKPQSTARIQLGDDYPIVGCVRWRWRLS